VPRYVIHIGPHKTGTTYLQHAFTRLRPELTARGITYPGQWGSEFGHHALAERLTTGEDPSLSGVFSQFNRSTSETILLSSETFSYADEASVRRLHALLSGEPAIVVFYCRRWSELIPSSWGQGVRHGSLLTFPPHAFSHLADPWSSELINFDHVLARWAAVFGGGSLRVASYNAVMETNEDLLTHFCRHFLGWPDPPPNDLGRINDSLDMVDHEIIRALNMLERIKSGNGRRILTMEYLAAKPGLPVAWLVEKAIQFNVESLRIDDASTALATLHTSLVARYRAVQVDPIPAMGLFQPQAIDVTYVRPDYLMVKGVLETLQDMHGKLWTPR
jgi:hypothetical protein